MLILPPAEINPISCTSTSSAASWPPTSSRSLSAACSAPHPRSEPGTCLCPDRPQVWKEPHSMPSAPGVCVLLPGGPLGRESGRALTDGRGGLLRCKPDCLSAGGALGHGERCPNVIAVIKEGPHGWGAGGVGKMTGVVAWRGSPLHPAVTGVCPSPHPSQCSKAWNESSAPASSSPRLQVRAHASRSGSVYFYCSNEETRPDSAVPGTWTPGVAGRRVQLPLELRAGGRFRGGNPRRPCVANAPTHI